MAHTFIEATDLNFPNLTLYRRYNDGEHTGYRLNANEGYVFYDSTEETFELKLDEETGNLVEVPVTYYYTLAYLTRNYNFDNFPYIAVPRDSVNENYIFGGSDNNHEIM